MKYKRIVDIQPGWQWDDAGGYCGAWSIQRAALAKGAWISQQQVRDHTFNCGGHDNEILTCNIDEALRNLKIEYEAFDFKNTPVPQTKAYFKWLKAQLVSSRVVVWMIMWDHQKYPTYDMSVPEGVIGHIEPVIGILSRHQFNNTKVYADDTIIHYTNYGTKLLFRKMSSLAGTWAGPGKRADCGPYRYCIGNPYGFGWAVKGFGPDTKQQDMVMPALLHIDPWKHEPDIRSGEKPGALHGTLTVTELSVGSWYEIYRWDSVELAFQDYSTRYRRTCFVATTHTYVYVDEKPFLSDSATYYRAVKQQQAAGCCEPCMSTTMLKLSSEPDCMLFTFAAATAFLDTINGSPVSP